ncbi:MAG: mechanosensitive ion channel family protein [Alphaproteobacteria bacterium]|nr:mechanosensitive ion channel family protein [Alphaproteobacteria bacterium]
MIEKELEFLTKLLSTLVEFAVTYGFQILGALVFLFIGLKLASFAGRRVAAMAVGKDLDQTLAKFVGNIVKIVIIAIIVVITLGNFGISIAPLIALAGAAAFGATIAIQGPLSNYGAGLSIILGRPFVVGNTIALGKTSGVVEEVRLAATVLKGEDGERITIPNKEIVGKVIVNSETQRIVETKIVVDPDADVERAIAALSDAMGGFSDIAGERDPQAGVHDFTYGGIVLGARFWVPSSRYYELRYEVNQALLGALRAAGVAILPARNVAVAVPPISEDEGSEDG